MDKQYGSLKMEYSIVDNFEDKRLIPIDILVMHDGVNYNGSHFSKEAMENAKETLKNIPILAYIKENEQGDKDFDGHNMEVNLQENKDGELEFKVKYLERPIGVIPETNDYHYEERDGRTYVACRGYLWREYLNDGLFILQENSTKGVSMEISVDNGNWDEQIEAYNISNYKYLGVTVLGDDVQPAMHQTKMEVASFSIDNKDFFAKVEQLNKKLKQSLFEGGENVTEEQTVEFTEEVEDITPPVTEETFEEVVEENIETTEAEETTEEFNEEVTEVTEEEVFSMEDYSKLLSDFELLKSEFESLKSENEKLESFKSEVLRNQKSDEIEGVFNKYSSLLGNDEIELFKSEFNFIDMTTDEIEKELSFRLVQKKFDFSKITKKDSTKITIKEDKDAKDPYGSASIYFNKK